MQVNKLVKLDGVSRMGVADRVNPIPTHPAHRHNLLVVRPLQPYLMVKAHYRLHWQNIFEGNEHA
jgi:hypothetical protein